MPQVDPFFATEKKVLVTGAGGFIGRYCLTYLLNLGYEVHAVSMQPIAQSPSSSVIWHQANLLNPYEIQSLLEVTQPTHILHLAWYTAHGQYWAAPENLNWVEASLQLVRAFVANGGKRILMAGSCAEYDWQQAGVCNETKTPLNPKTPYGVAKKSLFELVDQYQTILGYSAVWARLFFVYGPGESPTRLLPQVIRCLLKNKEVQCTHGHQQRDFLHVDDAARALVHLLDSHLEGAVNVGSGIAIAVRNLIEIAANRLEKNHLIEYGALPLASSEPALLVSDTKRLAQIGYTPKWTYENGVADTLQYWQKEQQSF